MKIKFLLGAMMIGCAFTAWADGYTDGIEYYKAGQYNNAKTVLTRTLNEAGTDKAMSYYYLGCIDMYSKDNVDLAAAKANFDKGIAANPECPYNYVGLGALDLRGGNAKAAEEQFKLAQKLGKKNHEITVDIARAYYKVDPVKYEKEVTKYLEKAHKDSKNAEPAIYILEGDMLFDQKDLGGAAGKYEQAIRFDQSNPEGYVKFATSYIGVNPEYTLQMLNELLAKQPNSALAQRELAERYYEVNQWSKAAEQYGKYMQNPNHFPEDKARYIVLIYASGDYPKAIQVADELLAQDPTNAQALRVKLLSQYETEDYAGAKQTAEKFISSASKHVNVKDYTTYAQALEKLGETDAALAQYQKAIEIDPTRADSYKNLSAAYTNAEMYQQAAEAFEQAIQADLEAATLTDYLTLSGRWMNAANSAEDAAVAAADAAKGIAAVDKVIEGADQVQPAFLQRKALLMLIGDGKQPTERVAQAYQALIEALDQDPANIDPENPANRRAWYKQAYQILTGYYSNLNDKEMSDAMYQKYNEFN